MLGLLNGVTTATKRSWKDDHEEGAFERAQRLVDNLLPSYMFYGTLTLVSPLRTLIDEPGRTTLDSGLRTRMWESGI